MNFLFAAVNVHEKHLKFYKLHLIMKNNLIIIFKFMC